MCPNLRRNYFIGLEQFEQYMYSVIVKMTYAYVHRYKYVCWIMFKYIDLIIIISYNL